MSVLWSYNVFIKVLKGQACFLSKYFETFLLFCSFRRCQSKWQSEYPHFMPPWGKRIMTFLTKPRAHFFMVENNFWNTRTLIIVTPLPAAILYVPHFLPLSMTWLTDRFSNKNLHSEIQGSFPRKAYHNFVFYHQATRWDQCHFVQFGWFFDALASFRFI